jgi:hypothetical protein
VRRFHRGDGWGRGSFTIPALAVAGTSYTGEWADSPIKQADCKPELNALRKFLASQGLRTRLFNGGTAGNVFCHKIWILVRRADFARAFSLAEDWLLNNESATHHIHDARS